MKMLDEKVIVITGGAGYLGRALARTIINHGGTPVLAEPSLSTAEKALKEFEHLHPKSSCIELDISDEVSISQALEKLVLKYGRVDGLVNSAYPRNNSYGTDFFDVSLESFNENVSSHLGGYFATMKAFARYFAANGGGSIVNLSSIYGVIAPKFEIYENTSMTMPAEYAAIKSAIIHLSRYIAKRCKGMNIRVNSVSPGGLENGQPASFIEKYNSNCLNKGMLVPEDITGSICFLLSDHAHYINGQNIIVDDGFTL